MAATIHTTETENRDRTRGQRQGQKYQEKTKDKRGKKKDERREDFITSFESEERRKKGER